MGTVHARSCLVRLVLLGTIWAGRAAAEQCELQVTLTASDGAAGDAFGQSVALSGDTVVVGAYEGDGAVPDAGSAYVYVLSGGAWTEQQALSASDGADGDGFGWSVSVSGDTAVVGALLDDDAGTSSGSAYVFVRSGGVWTQEQKLTASDAAANDVFGISVSVDGDTIVVGAGLDHNGGMGGTAAGSAYVFVRSGGMWSQQQKLIASDAASNDQFGSSVAVSGETIVVGSFLDNNAAGTDAGSAYVFVRSVGVWTQQQKLAALDAAAFDQFGNSVSVSGDTVIIGARLDDHAGGTDAGSAYVFVRSGGVWTQQQKLAPFNAGASGGQFGFSVSVSGDRVVIGAPFWEFETATNDQGTAYGYIRLDGAWQYRWQTHNGSVSEGQFGYSVAVNGDVFVMGANGEDLAAGIDVGLAQVILCTPDPPVGACCHEGSGTCGENETQADCLLSGGRYGGDDSVCATIDPPCSGPCGEEQNLIASDAAAKAFFGYSVWVGGDTAMVGATNLNGTSTNSDAVYVFGRSGGVWSEVQKLTASDAGLVDGFGNAVSVSGDTAVIGSYWDDNATVDAGAAYVFVHTGGLWIEQQKLTASDAGIGHRFGGAVSVSGDTIVVGAYLNGDPGDLFPPGAAYVFVRTGGVWTEQQKLIAADAGAGDRFGESVSVDGDTAVVGASAADGLGLNFGAAYVFVRSGGVWTQQPKLIQPAQNGLVGSFGRSISLSGDSILVSCREPYVFVRSAGMWNLEQRLTCADAGGIDDCAGPVFLSGDSAVVGADSSAYVFARFGGVWGQRQKLTAAGGFGSSVAMSGDTALVGARSNSHAGGVNAGSAYVFRCSAPCSPPDCGDHATCVDGACVCVAGYAGAACDQCAANHYNYPTCTLCLAATTCSGNGTCTVLGGCDCDPGWFGPNCSSTVCVSNDECDDDDACTQDVCNAPCTYIPRMFGDATFDGGVDIFDILCVLDGFAGVFGPSCTKSNVDLAPCDGDSISDIFDVLAVLDAFAGVNLCNCPAGP
ncbi:MAG: hypothetical protein HOP29_06530 [Phycisphaerales bacterium]|nr:hypothetical protein [Phycisphaerales bacterium]